MSGGDDEALDPAVDRAFDRVVAALDPAIVVVTTVAADDGERSGCLVGFSTQCSINPRRFLVCVSNANHTFGVVARATHLAVHLVPVEQRAIAELFGGETGDEVDKFDRCAWHPGAHDVPLLDACPDRILGRIEARHDLGDHLGLVLAPVAVTRASGSGAAADRSGLVTVRSLAHLTPGHPA